MESNNDDEEPPICTVFSSTASTHSKTIFDTISFSAPRKENSVLSPVSPMSGEKGPQASSGMATKSECAIVEKSPLKETDMPAQSTFESLPMSNVAPLPTSAIPDESATLAAASTVSLPSFTTEQVPVIACVQPSSSVEPGQDVGERLTEESLRLVSKEIDSLSLTVSSSVGENLGDEYEQQSPLPTANELFSNAPEVPFPVDPGRSFYSSNSFLETSTSTPSLGQHPFEKTPIQQQADAFSTITYSPKDAACDAWIPNESTRQVLMSIATSVNSGTYFPDKTHMTTPGVIYKEDLVDKVAVNMSRIFGEAEASKRQIFTADSVSQDDNGLRELVKLGCYRSAINLTKRLLTLHGQGPGKINQFSKHTPQSLQLWMTRISLLVRIREFKIAESELIAFKDFENPDMYYEYYQELYGQGRKGSMVPFHFRLIAAEIPQYASKDCKGSTNKLAQILQITQQILKNINEGISEDGSSVMLDNERRTYSMEVWRKREIRVYYALTNAFLLAKDFPSALNYLTILLEKDPEKKPQLTSAIGRLFLQYGDLTTAQVYFKNADLLRSKDAEHDRVENLTDAALYFIAQGGYSDALGLLKEALAIQPDNFMITNNMAVCLLYMGKVKESLALMENTVHNNKPQLLQENVILNLSTIYELENSDGFKKNTLLKLISEYKGDGINLASLKMPNLI